MGTLEEQKSRRGRSRTPRSGTSTVTSKSSVEKNTDNFVIDGVPTAYDYDSIVSEDEWLDEKSKGSRYMVEGQKQDQANRTKSLMSDDEEEEEDGDDQSETKSVDKYSHSNKELDKIPTIDRLWSQSMDSGTMQFQAPTTTTTTYKHSYFGSLTGNKAAAVSTANNNKRSNTKKDVDSNPSMMEPIYEIPKNRKKNKKLIVPQDSNSKMESIKTTDENTKPLKPKPSTSKVKRSKSKSVPKVAKSTETKMKPTDEISTKGDGSTTSSLTDPLEHMLLNSKNDSNKVVQDIEQKLDLLRAMAAEVDEKQRVLKEKQNKLLLKKKKSKNTKSGRSTSRSRSKSQSQSRSRSRSKSRSRSRSKSRSRAENTTEAKDRPSGSKSKHRSRSRTTKSSSSSTKKSSGTNHSKTPSLPVAQSEGVFSNAPTEPHRNHTPKNKIVDTSSEMLRNPATKSKRTSMEKKSIASSKNSTSDKMSKSSRKSENGDPSINKRRSRSRSSKRSTSRSSSKGRRKSSSKSGRERSSSRSHSRPRKSTTSIGNSSKRDSLSRPRSSSRTREKSRSRSRSQSEKSRSPSHSRSRGHGRDATTATSRSRSRSVPSTRDSQSRSRKSRSSTGNSKGKSNKEKGKKLDSSGDKTRTSGKKFNKYLLDSDLKEESVERARYELTKEMIALLEKSKLDELRNKKMYPFVKGSTTQRKKRKDILTNFTNFFRKSKHDEEVIVSNPASAESTNDENDSYNGLEEMNDENTPKPSTERRQSFISLKPKERVKSSGIIEPDRDKTVLHEKGNVESKALPVTAEKSKKAIDLKKVAVKRAAARKIAATEAQLLHEKEEEQPGKEETIIATIEEKLPSASTDTEVEKSVEEKEDGKSTASASELPKTAAEITADSTEQAIKKTGMMRRFVAKKKNKAKGLLQPKKASETVSFSESKDTHDIVEATRSVIDVVKPSVIKAEPISIPERVTNIMQDATGTRHNTTSEPSDTRSKSTNSVVTKVPEYLVAKSNPLEIDEYSITKEISNEPGMVQCLRFYSCGRTADVLNVAIHVSDNCNGDQHNNNNTGQSTKVKRKKSQIDTSFPGDAILQSRSMMTEVSYTTRKSNSYAPPEVHMPTVEVILEEESNPQVAETKVLERRDDVENMESIFASMTESDDEDESLEEAPDLRMPRVHSFIMDVSKMTLHLDEDPQERLTKDAIRRGVASAEEISITSIQVPTQQQQQERDDCATSSSYDGREDGTDDDDDCSTESGILDDGTNSGTSYDADHRSKRSKGRVQKIFSRFRTFRANKKLYSM